MRILLNIAKQVQVSQIIARRMIDIGNCYEAIGPLRASSVLGFHTFTGCDQTGKFRGKSKSTWWKSFMESSSKTLIAPSLLVSSESLPTLDVLEELESFVVQTYIGDKFPEHINTIPELRWYQFSKFQTKTDKLPPTASTLKYKIFRSHYVALVLKRSHLSLQNLPPPEYFGWEKIDGELVPIMTDCLPAPMALIAKPIDAYVRKTILLVQICANAQIVIIVVLKRMTIPI